MPACLQRGRGPALVLPLLDGYANRAYLRPMDEQLEFARQVAQRLAGAGIPYMMTGSMAQAVYAAPRMTRDVDFVVECTDRDVDRLVRLFEPDCYIERSAVEEAIATRGMFNVIHHEWIIKGDFVIRKDDPYRRTEFQRRREITVQGTPLAVVAPEDLILSKLKWAQDSGSELQRRDAREIVAAGTPLDWPYLEQWAAQLGVTDLLREVRR